MSGRLKTRHVSRTAVLLLSVLGGACTPAEPPVAEELKTEHPGCELTEKGSWRSESSPLYMRIKYRCPGQEPTPEVWVYEKQGRRWKRVRILRPGTSPPVP
jgi:hypothetical protein